MECPYCKADNREGVRYCSNCGKLIGATAIDAANNVPMVSGSPTSSYGLAPGTRLQGGRYVIKKVLGQGGMGTALLATDLRLDSKLVVIKELIANPSTQQDDIRNFKREVALLAHIDHPLVPSVTDHFQEGTRYFMVQEYVEGENLEEYMSRLGQPMRERNVLLYASEILDVLDYLSLQNPPIVHRDIKPANIIISDKDKQAHLVDFGIARVDIARNAQRRQTSALGTPGYAPPEQYQGNADPRSDLYALAATLHYLLTNRDPRGFPPFNYPPVRTLNPQLSVDIERVLKRALTNDIHLRYQNAAAMKRDIDEILRLRYGISGSLNTYTLGATGATVGANGSGAPINKPDSNDLTSLPTVAASAAPATPIPVSQTPAVPLVSPPSLPSQGQRRRPRLMYIALAVLLLLILLGAGGFAAFVYVHNNMHNGIGVTKVGNEYIGISDGTFVFDSTLPDAQLKQQAAALLKQSNSDVNGAISLLNQAIGQASNDAEAHIYLEDLRVQASGSPYITIVVGTMLSGDSGAVQVGRDDLQGAYVAQKEFNDGAKLHGGVKIRLLIASSGSQTPYATQVAQQIVQLAQSDKTFVGVMGWPYSSRALAVVQTLGAAHIPMVSQTASSDQLTNISPYFFRVAPSNSIQGIAGAHYIEQVLHAHTVALFEDQTDPYSQSLAQDFATQFQHDGNRIVATEQYQVGQPSTLPAALQDALSKNPDVIYFSGYANDVSTLLTDLPPGKLPVMGGDALYELGGYPSSARAGFSRLHFTAFAYPDEWDVLGLTAQKPDFFTSYAAAFDPNRLHQGSPYGFTRPDNDAILSYDATVALLHSIDMALTQANQNTVTPQQVQQALRQLNGKNAFQGVSGQIAFGADGNPVDKSIVILYVDPNGFIKMEPAVEGQFRLAAS
jgi:serine/threonine protein kinase/ABC-type branched-subunit amino acid transport system substrate-binding protein